MVRALRWNLDRDQNEVRLFELGETYAMSPAERPGEHRVLALGLTGHRRPASVHDSERLLDFFDLKGDLEMLLGLFEISEIEFNSMHVILMKAGRAADLPGEARRWRFST